MSTNYVTDEVAKEGKRIIAEKYNEEFATEEIEAMIDYHYKAMKALLLHGENVNVPRLGIFTVDKDRLKLLEGFNNVVKANAGVAQQ